MKQIMLTAVLCILTYSNTSAENLLDVYNLARNNDAEFRAETATYYASRQIAPQRRAALLPQLSGRVSSTENKNETEGRGSFDEGGNSRFSYSVSLDQSLYDHGQWQRLKQANIRVAQAEADYAVAQQELILRAAEAYFNVLAAEDNLRFAQSETRSVGQQLEQAKQRFQVGLIAITDVKESQAQYDQAVADEIAAQNLLDENRETLWTITNTDIARLAPLGENIALKTPEPANKQEWVDRALNSNLSLLSSGFRRDAARKEISIQRSGHYPTLSLNASRSFTDTEYDEGSEINILNFQSRDQEETRDSVSVRLSIPIYSGGATHAGVKEAIYRYDATRDQYELTRRRTIKQARDAYQNTVADISRVKALKQALVSSQAAYEATEAGFEVGTRNSVEVLLSLRNTFRAERDYARTRYDYVLNTLRLKEAVGNLTLDDIKAINRWLKK